MTAERAVPCAPCGGVGYHEWEARGEKDWIQTYTGQKFFPLDPDPAALDIRDIAHALSLECRYANHVHRHYSVAEHSVRISRAVQHILESADQWDIADVRTAARWGLVHDAAEAYLGDVPRPLKRRPEYAFYRVAEARLTGMIAAWLGLPPAPPDIVLRVDRAAAVVEAPRLFACALTDNWEMWRRDLGGETLEDFGLAPLWAPLSAPEAETKFIQRYLALWPDRDLRGNIFTR